MGEHAPQSDWFSRPGDSLLAAMQRRGIAPSVLASRLAGGICQLRGLVAGAVNIDRDSASAISDAVGGSAEFWLKRQANYERDLERAIQSIPAREAEIWLEKIPAPGPRPRGKVTNEVKRAELQRRMTFFGVSSLGAWNSRYGRDRRLTKFRDSASFTSDDGAVSLWLRQGELEASLIETSNWDARKLEDNLKQITRLSQIGSPELFLPKLKTLLASCGVALVALRAPKECKASGASRLIRPDKAMILVSFRHRSDDQFWFTVFHEIGHLLLHGAKSFVDEDQTPENDCEREANSFAASLIVPSHRFPEFEALCPRYKDIARFAVSVGVSSGLVLGQLQHSGRIPSERLTYLRKRWTWDEIDRAISNL